MKENWLALYLAIVKNVSVNQAVAVLDGEMTDTIAEKLKEDPNYSRDKGDKCKEVFMSEKTLEEVIELRKLTPWSALAAKYNINVSTLKAKVKKYKATKDNRQAIQSSMSKNSPSLYHMDGGMQVAN